MLFKWWKLGHEDRSRIWRLYGWFSGLAACGSCIGIVSWVAYMQFIVNNFTASELLRDKNNFSNNLRFADYARWKAAYLVTYAVEFLCLSAAQLMVLDRMSEFAAARVSDTARWVTAGRGVMAVVVLGNAVGLAGNMAAAARMSAVYERSMLAYEQFAANNRSLGEEFAFQSKRLNDEAETISSVQAFCEVVVLLIIVLAFAVVGITCLARVKLMLRVGGADAAAVSAGKQVRSQILGTTATIFVAFLLRSVFAFMDAVSGAVSNSSNSCRGNTVGLCNATCYNMYTHMENWMTRTPEFRVSIVLISFPVSLLVALWGMTSGLMRRLMRNSTQRDVEVSGESRIMVDK
jgi:hypothetical protein